ncbi:MAG: RagB/SusD family nutrient uptake outer membrane protein, partial [Hymenobacter sp.]
GLTSCKKFLEEKPESFLSSAQFFQTPNQLQTAVDGCYKGLERPYVSVFLGLPLSEYWSLESLTGLSTNPFGTGNDEASYQRLDEIDPLNSYLLEIFRGVYVPMANINNAIVNIEPSTVVDEATKNKYLGQLYFLRAWHYFHGVQLMGEIPLVTAPPASIKDEDVQVPKATIDKVYAQIVADLTKAEASGLPYQDVTGHVTMSAVKTLLAKVYLTMAGFPLNKGQEYYQKSYDKAKELINEPGSGLRLFPNYADLRNKANHNIGEHIFMVQRKKINANNELHFGMLPSPGKVDPPISVNTVFDTALLPTIPFYNTYKANDKRKAEKSFFYTYVPGEVMNYKFWDDDAAVTGSSGNNIWLLRYADLLLICAEAKAKVE